MSFVFWFVVIYCIEVTSGVLWLAGGFPSTSLRKLAAAVVVPALLIIPLAIYVKQSVAQERAVQEKIDCWKQHRTYEPYVRCIASQMEPSDPARREHFGEEYGAEKYLKCALTRPPGDTYCDRHRLKRRPEREYWPNANKVAPPKWPEAPKESVYRNGMKPKEYFDALCKAEAGEFIYKTVENVEGIYQIRPRLRASTYELRDRYVMEDPYGYSNGEVMEPENYFVQPPIGTYRFLEVPNLRNDRSTAYIRYSRGDPVPGKKTQTLKRRADGNYSGRVVPYVVHNEPVARIKSRYGYTWRGIQRLYDRDNSIAGGELIVVDLQTNEVLGLRRGFALTRTKSSAQGANWEIAAACSPRLVGSQGHQFIKRVLKPSE